MGAFEDFVRAELPNRQVLLIGSGNPASGSGTVAAIGAYWLDKDDGYKRYVRFGLNNTDWELVPTWATSGGGGGTVNLPQSAYWETTYSVVSASSGDWDSTYSTVSANSGGWDHGSAGYLTSITIAQSAFWESTYSVVSANSGDWNASYSYTSTNSGVIDSATALVTSNSAAWNTAGGILTIAQSAEWNSVYSTVSSSSADWNNTYTAVSTTSADWDSTYTTVSTNSASWDSTYSTVSSNSASWDSTYTTVTANSADWDSTYTTVSTNSADWDSTYSTVSSNSADWDSTYTTVSTNSADWDSTYSTVTANSADWDSTYSTVSSNSADWDSTYTTVSTGSADWDSTYTTVTANSADWSSTYTTVTANSADWNTSYTTVTANSADWSSTHTTVSSNSADWNTAYLTVTANSADWDSTYTTVSSNSADWNSTYTTVSSNSADWDSTYTTVTANSADWDTTYSTVCAYSADWNDTHTTVSGNSADWDLGFAAYSVVSANSAVWGSAQGDGSSGSGSVIAPLAYASMSTATSGEGTNLDWYYTFSSGNFSRYQIEFHNDQIDTDYTVVTDAQSDDVNRAVVTNKTVSGFQVDIRSITGGPVQDSLGVTVMVYGSSPLIGTGFDPNNTGSGSDSDLGSAAWTTITANSASWLGGAGDGVGAAGAFITNITCGTNGSVNDGITNLTKVSNEISVDGKTPVISAVVDTPTVRLWTQWEGSATEWTGCPLISTFPVSANTRSNISNGLTRRFQGYYDLDLTAYRGSTATIPLEYSGLTKYVDVAVAGLGPEVVDFQVISTPQYGQDHYKDGDSVTFVVVFDTTDIGSISFGGAPTYAIKSASNVPVSDSSITMNGVSATCVREVDTTSVVKVNKAFSITAKNAFGTEGSEYISSGADVIEVVSGPIITNIAVGSLPGSQTELKHNDQIDITMEFDTTNVDYVTPTGSLANTGGNTLTMNGVSATKTFSINNSTTQTDTAGGVATTFYLSVKKNGHHDQTGPQMDSQSDFSTQLPINNRRPAFSAFTITYPDNSPTGGYAQQALQGSDTATVGLTISQAGASPSISWTNNGITQLTIADPTTLQGAGPNTYAQSKTVTRAGGTYNISNQNIRCEVTRTENDNTFSTTGVVKIADSDPTIRVYSNSNSNSQGLSIKSGGTNGTSAQNGNIRMVSDQQLLERPTLQAPNGGTLGQFSYNSTATIFNATMIVTDSDPKGTKQYGTLNAVNLAGKVVNTISTASNSSNSYKLGGFVERTLIMATFSRTVGLGTNVFDPTKIVVTENSFRNTSLTFSSLADTTQMDASRGSSGVDGVTQFTVVDSGDLDLIDYDGDTFFYVDKTAVNNNSTGGMNITIREEAS